MRLLAASVVTLTFALSPAAQAQSPSPSPVAQAQSPSPDLFCGLLTTDEVGGALGFAVTVTGGSQSDCNWQGDVNAGVITSLTAAILPGTVDSSLKAGFPSGTDLSIGGNAAYYVENAMWVAVSGRLLLLQLIFPSTNVADPQAALTALATIAVARFDSLSIPEQTTPSPEPQPSFVGDVALKDLFPADLRGFGGAPLDITTITGPEAMANASSGNAKGRKSLEQLVAAAAPQGKTIDDVSIGFATVYVGSSGAQLVALRVRGADVSALLPQAVPLFVANFLDTSGTFGKPQQAPAQVAGKDVTMLTPAKKSPLAGSVYGYIYAHDDVLWLVAGPGNGQEPVSTEILRTLP